MGEGSLEGKICVSHWRWGQWGREVAAGIFFGDETERLYLEEQRERRRFAVSLPGTLVRVLISICYGSVKKTYCPFKNVHCFVFINYPYI